MNEKINADLKSLKFIFDRNKPYALASIIIFACIILFFQFLIPQFNTLLTARKQAKEASLTLALLKENLNVLTNSNENSLDSQLKVLNLALPFNKDFTGILSSIYYASQKTGVSLGAFSLQIGGLSEDKNNDKFSTISLSIPVNSNIAGVNGFVENISKSLPLSEVTLVKIGETISTVNLAFYYKPLGVVNSVQSVRVNPVSQKGLSLINELTSFQPVATSSAAIE